VGRALRNKLGLGALPLAPVPRRVDPSAVLGRPFRDGGTVRLRTMPGEPIADDWPLSWSLPAAPCFRSEGGRGRRSMRRQPSGPSSSLRLTFAVPVIGGVSERDGVGDSAGGGGVSSMNQS
jgi:hypothetical protein